MTIEPGPAFVARLSQACRNAPDASRFVIHNDAGSTDRPPLGEGRVGDAVSVVGVPVSDTVKEVVGGTVRRTVPRETLIQAIGPWVVSREALVEALARIEDPGSGIEDLLGFCQAARLRVRVLGGS